LNTQTLAGLTFPTHALIVPAIRYTAGIQNDHLQLQVVISAQNQAGLTVDAGTLEAIPLRLT
jgi:EamA domain-containing membrane protein RarD